MRLVSGAGRVPNTGAEVQPHNSEELQSPAGLRGDGIQPLVVLIDELDEKGENGIITLVYVAE